MTDLELFLEVLKRFNFGYSIVKTSSVAIVNSLTIIKISIYDFYFNSSGKYIGFEINHRSFT